MGNELIIGKYYRAILDFKYTCARNENYEMVAILRTIENTYFRVESDCYQGFNPELFLKEIQNQSSKFNELKSLVRDITIIGILG